MAEYASPTEYIHHHLTFLAKPVHESGGFWTVHWDTVSMSLFVGVVTLGFLWLVTRKATTGVPSRVQAFVELAVGFVNDQARSLFHEDLRTVAPIALTVFVWVLFMNAIDVLPVDWMSAFYTHVLGQPNFRGVATADVNTTFALALSVFALSIFYHIKVKGLGGWLHELLAAPFGIRPLWAAPVLIPLNLLFNAIEYISKPLSHSLRLYGNMYAGEIMFLLLAMFAASGIVGTAFGGVLNVFWAGFDLFICALQAYIFMMLTVVYIAMAHEHH